MRTVRHRPLLVLAALLLVAGLALAARDCPACGAENRDDAKFCKTCGAKLPEVEQRYVPQTPRVRAEVSVSGAVVSVTSEPSGASVTIDGVPRGQTPLELGGLSTGRHSVSVTHPGYREYSSSFNVAGQSGTIVITTEPTGAQVWVDGDFRGSTTETGLAVSRLLFGRHRIVARREGFRDAERQVDLATAGPIAVSIRLETGLGFLSLRSTPAGAAIAANGVKLGQTDALLELQPDRYMLTLTRPGYNEWVGYSQVTAGETSYVFQALERIKVRKLPFLIAGAAGLLVGGGAAAMAEMEYAKYQDATNAADADRYHRSTEFWDMTRNVGLGAGAALSVCYILVRW